MVPGQSPSAAARPPWVDLERDTIQYHTMLNPVAWDGFDLKPEVRAGLQKVAQRFIESWGVDIPTSDIILTGSNANYNWTPYSDFDVHVVVRMDVVPDASQEFVKGLLRAKKSLWNEQHHITIKGYDVEVYAQDTDEVLIASGVYSLKYSSWLAMPEMKPPEWSHPDILAKAATLADEIDAAVLSPDENVLHDLVGEISDLRKSGLSTVGEFSTENLAFKLLRNSGHIKKLRDTLGSLIDSEMTVEQSVLTFGEYLNEHLGASGRYLKQRNLTRNRWKLHRRSQIALGVTGNAARMKRRGMMAARRIMYRRLLGVSPTQKSHLTSTQKLEAERMMHRLAPSYIKNLAPRTTQVASRLAQRKRLTKRYGNLKAYRR